MARPYQKWWKCMPPVTTTVSGFNVAKARAVRNAATKERRPRKARPWLVLPWLSESMQSSAPPADLTAVGQRPYCFLFSQGTRAILTHCSVISSLETLPFVR
jgi:hypothetical protein